MATIEREIADLADDLLACANRIVALQLKKGDLPRMTEWAALTDLARTVRAEEVGGRR